MYHDKIPITVCLDPAVKADKLVWDARILSGVVSHAPVEGLHDHINTLPDQCVLVQYHR